jgi:hypothetical protein
MSEKKDIMWVTVSKKRAELWKNFRQHSQRLVIKCNLCNREFSSTLTTTNASYHLEHSHGIRLAAEGESKSKSTQPSIVSAFTKQSKDSTEVGYSLVIQNMF